MKTQREGDMKTEIEIRIMPPQAKDGWPPPEAGRDRGGFSSTGFRSMALPTPQF